MPAKRSRTTDKSKPSNKKAKVSSRKKSKPSIRSQRSIWNSKDDWDTLVAESSLSTSSISTRQPRFRGLPTLVECTTKSISRSFKRLWESGVGDGKEFRLAWEYLPNHLKEGIRDNVYKLWGSYLTVKIISEVFVFPPHLYLPGELLPSISTTDYIKTLIPSEKTRSFFTSLTLKHASKGSDLGISALIYNLPNLDTINLKGCELASGNKTIKVILDRITGLKSINLKGTKIVEQDVKDLLDKFGKRLEVFKVDNISFENINDTYSSLPFPRFRKLCLPGDLLNLPLSNTHNRARSKILNSTNGHPIPRQTNPEYILQWQKLDQIFPNLTHLTLINLLIPDDTVISLKPNQLQKLVIGPGGPPIPLETLSNLLQNQVGSIKALFLGHVKSKLLPSGLPDPLSYETLGIILNKCEKLEEFRLQVDQGGSKNSLCDLGMSKYSNLIYGPGLTDNWRRSLKKLILSIPQIIDSALFFPSTDMPSDVTNPHPHIASPLEQLDLPSANIDNTEVFSVALKGFPMLRSLDLSGTTITDDDMKIILNDCHLLSRIDLTSCRGINVRHRRNIFQALQST
ncbi:uncharacterized protein L201_003447 [Kwoniella dendrophila CBS 6074]|uniref:RNI-like protein n=1 Tax=Kwoniella dendrophila CBS 6074 TaxID=1295534 RepID=A0AAX4JTK6_9TREE